MVLAQAAPIAPYSGSKINKALSCADKAARCHIRDGRARPVAAGSIYNAVMLVKINVPGIIIINNPADSTNSVPSKMLMTGR